MPSFSTIMKRNRAGIARLDALLSAIDKELETRRVMARSPLAGVVLPMAPVHYLPPLSKRQAKQNARVHHHPHRPTRHDARGKNITLSTGRKLHVRFEVEPD